MCSPLQVPPEYFNQIEVWTVTGPMQHLDYFLFQSCCCSFAAVILIFVLLHDHGPVWPQLLAVGRWPHI